MLTMIDIAVFDGSKEKASFAADAILVMWVSSHRLFREEN